MGWLTSTGTTNTFVHMKRSIYTRQADATVAIIAPHGGKIERGTSELARAIGGTDYRIYCFEGTKPNNNRDLHITSTNFDEPEGVKLVSACDRVVALHGCAREGDGLPGRP